MQTGYDLIWIAAERTPDHVALVDDRTERKLTYRELLREVDEIAAGLLARGVRAGTRVATILPNLFEHCLVLIALQRLAAVPALLNFRLPPDQLAALVRQGDMAAAVIRGDATLANAITQALPASGLLLSIEPTAQAETFAQCRGDPASLPERPEPRPDDLAFIFYTSGTTGLPKGVLIAHRTTEHRIVWLAPQAGLRHGSYLRTLATVPLSHAIGFYGTFLATLAFNGTFYTMSAFNPATAVELIERHRINYLFAVPTIYHAMMTAPNYQAQRMSSLELVLHGGAPIAPELLDRIDREWGGAVRHIYGTTEVMCALYNPDPVGRPRTLRPGYYSRVRVVEFGGTPHDTVPPGAAGELIVDATGDSIFSGYLNRPELTAEKVRDGWYFTGDVCVRRDDGDVDLIGRVDDVIRSGGESIYPEEVEAVLSSHAAVREACVVGIPDPLWGEMAVACVVCPDQRTTAGELDAHCRGGALAGFKRPRAYVFMDALPRNAANKVLRRVLTEQVIQASQHHADAAIERVAA